MFLQLTLMGSSFIMQCLAFVVVLGLDRINALNSLSCSVNNFSVILRSSYPCSPQKISDMLKNSLGLLKEVVAEQSRIKRIIWHLRWLVRTRADISLQSSG